VLDRELLEYTDVGCFQVGKDVGQEPLFVHDGIVGGQGACC
jgi:hypothetical protein